MTNGNDAAYSRAGFYADVENCGESGLTKREYFAALAMQGLLANGHYSRNFLDAPDDAIKFADTLIYVLNKEKNSELQ